MSEETENVATRTRWAPHCLNREKNYVRWNRYFCTQRCAAEQAEGKAYEEDMSWDPSEERWRGWADE